MNEKQKELVSVLEKFETENRFELKEDTSRYLFDNGFPNLGFCVYISRCIDPSTLLRQNTSKQEENMILSNVLRMIPCLVNILSSPPLYLNGTSNSCIYLENDKYILNCRMTNYKLARDKANQFLFPEGVNYFDSNNIYVEISSSLDKVMKEHSFEKDKKENGYVRGIEDIRILKNDSRYYYIGTIFHNEKLMMSFGEYDVSRKCIERNPIESPYNQLVEKNWAMFVKDNEFWFVYRWSPLEIGKIKNNKLEIVYRRRYELNLLNRVKGSSCGIVDPIDGKLWFLVHFHTDNDMRQYYHMFIIIDPKTFSILKISSPFTFEQQRVEFGIGLVVESNRILVSYTVFDETCRVASYDRTQIEKLLMGHNSLF